VGLPTGQVASVPPVPGSRQHEKLALSAHADATHVPRDASASLSSASGVAPSSSLLQAAAGVSDAATATRPSRPTPPDYEALERAARTANIADIHRQVASGKLTRGLRAKVGYRAKMNGERFEDILAALATEPHYAESFAVPPSRQSLHERAFRDYLDQLVECEQAALSAAIKLPNGGEDALRVTSNGVVHADEMTTSEQLCKSIDFCALLPGAVVYVSHKHTKVQGGVQDLAFEDLRRFVTAPSAAKITHGPVSRLLGQYRPRPAIFVAVADGAYWDVRLDELRSLTGEHEALPGSVFVTSSSHIADLFDDLAAQLT
jgi:hypothetical protein